MQTSSRLSQDAYAPPERRAPRLGLPQPQGSPTGPGREAPPSGGGRETPTRDMATEGKHLYGIYVWVQYCILLF